MIDPQLFISNIVTTCTNNRLIREDGKNLNIFNRIADLFRGKHNYQHFSSVCKKLSEICSNGEIKSISSQQGLEILGRLREIHKNIKNQEVKQECNIHIKQLEELFLKKEFLDVLSVEIFKDIKDASKTCSKQKIERDIRKLNVILDYYGNDKDVIIQVIEIWNHSFVEEKTDFTPQSIDFFKKANNQIIKKLLIIEEKILLSESSEKSDSNFEKYPYLFRLHLESEYKKLNKDEIYRRILTLKKLMDQHAGQEKFIFNCLQNIDQFLENAVFRSTNSLSLSEFSKGDLLVFRDFFSILDQHLPSISDKELALKLKLKCANLPCPTVRSSFKHLFLSEKDQLDLLIEGLQKQENETVGLLVQFLQTNNPAAHDISRIAKLVSEKSGLSKENLLKLRNVLESRLNDQSPKDWEDYRNVKTCFEDAFLVNPGQTMLIRSLKRICKSKVFFINQLGLEEDAILIPRWYHATHQFGIKGIITTGEIQVRQEKVYRGAWLSDQREEGFGNYVLTLSNKVTDLDPKVFIGYEHDHSRWRGVQKPIPIKKNQKTANLIFVGVPSQMDKVAQKTDKLNLVKILKEKGFPNPQAFSVHQVDFIQMEVKKILGTPNLSDRWWGKGKAYSEHQISIHSNLQSVPLDPDLFKVKSDSQNQLAIAKIVQSTALPLYKQPMPPKPSYRSRVTSLRVELTARWDHEYREHCDKVNKKIAPARGHHGAMHCVRVALWTQILSKAYEKLGRAKINNTILLATGGAFHDVARENEDIDYWDGESSEALQKLLEHAGVDEKTIHRYVQAVRDKDPENSQFMTDEQRIIHDADCVDIIRVIGEYNFNKKFLCFYGFDNKQNNFCDRLIKEMSEFINITENINIRNYLEHNSDDFYGDLVRLLFALKIQGKSKFPLLTELIRDDMHEILKIESTESTKNLISIIHGGKI